MLKYKGCGERAVYVAKGGNKFLGDHVDIFIKINLFLHLSALVLALGAGMGLTRIGPFGAEASADQKVIFYRVVKILGDHINIGLAILWVTGLLMLWLKYDWGVGISHWFWVKMLLVLVLTATAGIGSKARRLMMAGDVTQAPKARRMGQIAIVSGLLTILCAVFTFN